MSADRIRGALLAALVLALTVSGARADEVPSLERLFPLEAGVEVEGGGIARLVLPPQVLSSCRPDLSDLRLFDEGGREIALLIDSGREDLVLQARERFEPRVLDLRREETRPDDAPVHTREIYRIEAPLRAPELGPKTSEPLVWELVFEKLPARFVREVRVLGADAEGNESVLVDGTSIFRLDPETERVRVPLPALDRDRQVTLSVEIEGDEGRFLEPRLRLEAQRRFDAASLREVPLEEISRESRDGRTEIELARPPGIVPRLLRFETATAAYSRTLQVWDERAGEAPASVARGRVFRLAGTPDGEKTLLPLAPSQGATLRISIDDGDSPPLEAVRIFAVVRQPLLVFELPERPGGVARATLRFGGGRAHRPRYDLSAFEARAGERLEGARAEIAMRLRDATALPMARLGPIGPNPLFDASPALRFAMHPGAALDERIFAHRRTLRVEPSAEGLSRLKLLPADTAVSREDLGDLRIVDADGRQWPYLLQRDAYRASVRLASETQAPERKRSRYRLLLPVSPLRVERITLDMDAPYFDRPYRLLSLDERGYERPVSQGRLVKDARLPASSSIGIAASPSYGFVLEIENGDDAPLPLVSAEARVPLPVLFLAAPAGEYSLLLGDPELMAPRYELERVRDVVLAVEDRPVESGELVPNSVFSLSARLQSDEGTGEILHSGIVWGVLVAAVAILGLLTLRVARHTPDDRTTRAGRSS